MELLITTSENRTEPWPTIFRINDNPPVSDHPFVAALSEDVQPTLCCAQFLHAYAPWFPFCLHLVEEVFNKMDDIINTTESHVCSKQRGRVEDGTDHVSEFRKIVIRSFLAEDRLSDLHRLIRHSFSSHYLSLVSEQLIRTPSMLKSYTWFQQFRMHKLYKSTTEQHRLISLLEGRKDIRSELKAKVWQFIMGDDTIGEKDVLTLTMDVPNRNRQGLGTMLEDEFDLEHASSSSSSSSSGLTDVIMHVENRTVHMKPLYDSRSDFVDMPDIGEKAMVLKKNNERALQIKEKKMSRFYSKNDGF
jgi:hypothetical protein